jgi:membrane-associated phospholipid phosphatase
VSASPASDRGLLRRRDLPPLLAVAVLLIAAGAVVQLAGFNTPWMLRAHAEARGAFASVFWSSATIVGLGWSAVILVLAADRGDGRVTALLAPAFILTGLLTHIPKVLLASPRPAGTAILPHLHVIGDAFRGSVSMPSGHSVAAGAMAALLCVALPRSRALVGGALLLLAAALIAWSRVMVGAHWPADVLVGSGVGLLSVGLVIAAALGPMQRVHHRFVARIQSRAGQRWVGVLEIVAAIGLLREHTGYPDGRAMVILLALVAFASAAWRLHAAGGLRKAARPDEPAPVEPT